MICDRLVCGINEDSIQKCLLTEGDTLTLVKAISIAQSYETAEKTFCQQRPSHNQYTESNLRQLKRTTRSATDVEGHYTCQVPVALGKNGATTAIKLDILNELAQ